MADDATLQARISELPPATKTNDSDQFEVTQGSPGVSRRVSLELLRDGVKPDLSRYLTGLVGGPGIVVAGGAPVPSVSLETLGGAGSWGDGLNIPQVTVDDHGRVISVVLVPITPTDLSGYAPLDSPTFVGNPTAPLAAARRQQSPASGDDQLGAASRSQPRRRSMSPALHRDADRTDAGRGYQRQFARDLRLRQARGCERRLDHGRRNSSSGAEA